MKKLLFIFTILFGFLAQAQVDEAYGYKVTGAPTGTLDALSAAIKQGLITYDQTLGKIVFWNGTEFVEVGGEVADGSITVPKLSTEGTLTEGVTDIAVGKANGNIAWLSRSAIGDGTGTDDQLISTTGAAGNITIEDGNTLNLNVDDADFDPTNEGLQDNNLAIPAATNRTVSIPADSDILFGGALRVKGANNYVEVGGLEATAGDVIPLLDPLSLATVNTFANLSTTWNTMSAGIAQVNDDDNHIHWLAATNDWRDVMDSQWHHFDPSQSGGLDSLTVQGAIRQLDANKMDESNPQFDGVMLPTGALPSIGSSSQQLFAVWVDDVTIVNRGNMSTTQGWRLSPGTGAEIDKLEFLTETSVTSNLYTDKPYTLDLSGTPVDGTDLITKAYADANYSGGGGGTAATTTYDNTTSGLTATDVQAAVDEIVVDASEHIDSDTAGLTGAVQITNIVKGAEADIDTWATDNSRVDLCTDCAPADESSTGSVIDMGGYTQYYMSAASATTSWTLTNTKAGGYAEVLINTATEPTITGATQLPNTTAWVANTNMVMTLKAYGSTVKYYYVEY